MELRVGEILLRPPREGDLGPVVAACSDSEIPRFIPFIPTPYSDEAGRSWLANCQLAWRGDNERTFAIAECESNELLGAITVRLREGGSVGFWLSREARGRGLMTEAVRAVVGWARSEHGIERFCLLAHPQNLASQRVAEKAGFVRVGSTLHEPPFPDGTSEAIRFELT